MSAVQGTGGTKFGPYTIYERLGQGGMCLVFRARHESTNYDCALKVLRPDRRADERVRDLFITEADVSLLLDHPNLIRTYEAGEVEGRHFISMELMQGGTLAELQHQCAVNKLPLPQDFVLYILSEVLEGLHNLHEATGRTGRPLGIIHRDVTPQNIFVSFDGRVILGDFGVAMIGAYGDTAPGEVLGKLGYLAPEMVNMEEVDHRADLFAAGVVLYELLTHARLYQGDDQEDVLEDIAKARVPRPREVRETISRGLEQVLLRALARRPRDRFQSAEDMLYALEPHWSKQVANPYALAALLRALYPDRAAAWRVEHQALAGTFDLTPAL
ncbi:MAG: serine/threonine protein kinase [Deltaproteobacteria bacterium]|nr:serine/threonine protein kinase [Deltaproteobacteria bacterium]